MGTRPGKIEAHGRLGVMILVLMALSACGDGNREGGGLFAPGGIFGPRDSRQDIEVLEAGEIYHLAEAELEDGDPEEAARLFNEIERLHPYSDWAKRALIMAAFSYHSNRDYEGARGAAQRFIDFYPADEDAAYAQYLLALSYYDQLDHAGRDQGITIQALQALRMVFERYPDSAYASSAILKFDLAFDQLAAKQMEIGRYYLRRGHNMAAINRFRVVVEEFQTTSHTPEALMRLVEAYLSLGLTDEAQTAGAILGYNFQSSPFYEDAFNTLTGRDLAPEASGKGWLWDVWQQTVRGARL